MSRTPKRIPLPSVDKEIDIINTVLPPSINRVKLENPTKSQVLENIKNCSIAQFACHGEVDPNPSKSRILLSDWEIDPLSVADMAVIKLHNGHLAYLSTCHAANNRNLALLDEAMHMAGSCQLAGFPVVVGTLWQVSGEFSARVAELLTISNDLDATTPG